MNFLQTFTWLTTDWSSIADMSIPGSSHQQYSIILKLSAAIAVKLQHSILQEAYSLSKEEIVLIFRSGTDYFTVKLILRYRTCFLLFDDQEPAKPSNAQSCFTEITGQRVETLEQHTGTRSFALLFQGKYQLVFKLYDSLSNIVLYDEDKAVDMFRIDIANDWETGLGQVKSADLDKVNNQTAGSGGFYIYKREHTHHPYYLSDTPTNDEQLFHSDDILLMQTEFGRLCLSYYHFYVQKQQILQSIAAEIKKTEKLIIRSEEAFQSLSEETTPEEIAHIIMANLHAVPSGITTIELYDFYHDNPLIIKLKKELNAQQNAAYYYRKSRNRKIETGQIEQKLLSSAKKLEELKIKQGKVEEAMTIKALKPFIPKVAAKQQAQFPFKQFECDGFQIWVGKSAANNDELTVKRSHKNDLWLHAKDVTGSHVLIKWQPGKEYSGKAITYAAQLAAYYSKLKGSKLVPVIYTSKKFVRKPKGAEPGMVKVDKEEIIMVEPRLGDIE